MLTLLLSTNQSHISEKFLVSSSFTHSPDLYAEITNMYHLGREIDHNLQLVAYRLCRAEITKVQVWSKYGSLNNGDTINNPMILQIPLIITLPL